MNEYAVKSAYLFNFTKFVEWPADTFKSDSNVFTVGIMGDDPFSNNLRESLNNKLVQNRNIVVKHVSSLEEAAACQILFISVSEENRLKTILKALQNNSVFTVAEIDQFTQRGGMLGFKIKDNHVRFDINLAAAQKAKLEISSQLLKLALHVDTDTL